MENLELFYRVLNADLSPIFNQYEQGKYVDFLEERFPAFIRQFKIRVLKKNSGYKIEHSKEFSFPELFQTTNVDSIKTEIDQELVSFVCKTQGMDRDDITYLKIEKHDQWFDIEIVLKEDYGKLPTHKACFFYYKILMEEAVKEVQKHLHDKVFSLTSEKEIRLHIRNYQALAGSYMKTILHNFIPKNQWQSLYQLSEEYSVLDIFKLVYQSLEEIVVFIEKSFSQYLDIEMSMPYQSRLLFAMEYAEKLAVVLDHLEQAGLDDRLSEIIGTPFENLGKLKPLSFSYRDQLYHEAYLTAFYQATQEKEPLEHKKVLIILWRMNFNSLKYFNYVTSKMKQELAEKERAEDRLELLYYYQKLCNQILVRSHQRYNPELPALRNQIKLWLREEVGFQKATIKTSKAFIVNGISGDKRLIHLSVAQISLIARAFFETGLVNGSRKDLFRFLAETYRTDQQEDISIDSLSSKYYKIETGTKRSVGRMMKKMLAHIENAGKMT